MYASRKVQGFSSRCRPETHFRLAQGHERAGALIEPLLTGYLFVSANMYQNKNITVNGVQQQKRKNFEIWKTDYLVSRINQRVVSSLLAKKLDGEMPNYREKSCFGLISLLVSHRIKVAITSPILDSSCFKLFLCNPIRSFFTLFPL